ncbi:ABC transporter substrate-binding protein [Microbacterium sp.]|uniref:ABC transporter substrate-binding protein n=1 Tax=Microbacterium sp. TaxID=51671 RepID=UPI003A914D0A
MSISTRWWTPRRRNLTGAAVLTIGALALTACSGVAGQTGDTTTNAAACATITIGAPLPLSGPYTAFGQTALNGTELAVKEVNAAGGIKSLGGAKLKLEQSDTSSADTTQAASATSKLISDGAVALLGAWSTVLTAAVAPVAERSEVPLITTAWGDPLSANGYKYYFQTSPKSSVFGGEGAQDVIAAAKAAGITFQNVLAIAPNDAANQAQYKAAVKTFTDAGANAPAPIFYAPPLTDVSAIVNTVVKAKPDLILTGGGPADATLIVKGLRDAGVTAPLMGFGGAFAGTDPTWPAGVGDGVNGIMVVTAWNDDIPLDGVSEAAKAYTKAYGTAYMPDHAGVSWVNTHLLADAIEKAASCDPADIAAALRSIDVTSGPGAAIPGGQVSFDATGINPHAVPLLLQWQGNVPVTIWPQDLATAKLVKG